MIKNNQNFLEIKLKTEEMINLKNKGLSLRSIAKKANLSHESIRLKIQEKKGIEKKPPSINFYCKKCKKLGRQKDFLMPVNNLNGIKGISVACIHCLHDQGFRFKQFEFGD